MGLVFADFQRTHCRRRRRRREQREASRNTYKPSPFGQSQINFKRTNEANATSRASNDDDDDDAVVAQKESKNKQAATTTTKTLRATARARAAQPSDGRYCDKCVYDRKGVLTNQSSSFARSLPGCLLLGPHFVHCERARLRSRSAIRRNYTGTHTLTSTRAHEHMRAHEHSSRQAGTHTCSHTHTHTPTASRARSTQFAGAELCVV